MLFGSQAGTAPLSHIASLKKDAPRDLSGLSVVVDVFGQVKHEAPELLSLGPHIPESTKKFTVGIGISMCHAVYRKRALRDDCLDGKLLVTSRYPRPFTCEGT